MLGVLLLPDSIPSSLHMGHTPSRSVCTYTKMYKHMSDMKVKELCWNAFITSLVIIKMMLMVIFKLKDSS